MRAWFLSIAAAASVAAAAEWPSREVAALCEIFKADFPSLTFLPEDAGYANETEVPWSTTAWIHPGCIFAPSNAEQLSFAIKALGETKVKFAMRGGGHMPIASANSIGTDGVLISSTNLSTLSLSTDNETLSVGPGPRWTDAYTLLEGTGRQVVGGRIGPVGIPGLLLGGGISFYSYEYGMASTNGNVKAYQCVLADGRIVEVTSCNKYSDLFWALQGGGNSFCLVTRFDLQTHPAPTFMFGSPSYGQSEVKDAFIDSVYNFAQQGHMDPKSAIIPVAQYHSGSSSPDYSATLVHTGNNTSPAILQDFLGGRLSPLNSSNTLFPFSLARFSQAVTPSFQEGGLSHGSRQRFHLLPIKANLEAMRLVHDAYFAAAQATFADVEGAIIGFAFNPITSQLLRKSNEKPGSLQGLNEDPACWIEQTYSWKNAADDALFDNFIRNFEANITEPLRTMNATSSFYYLNEADEGQPVFESYPDGNLARLKRIRAKYDPKRVFTDLMPGGFKVDAA